MILAGEKFHRRTTPPKAQDKNAVSWRDMLDRVKRATSDMRCKPGADVVVTSKDGSEAVGCVEMLNHPGGLPPGAVAWFGFIVGHHRWRGNIMYGGVVSNGTACVLDCYGSYRASSPGKALGGWGMLVDQAVAKMSVGMTVWGGVIKALRDKSISKDRADLACYRAFASGSIKPEDFVLLKKLRRAGVESPWHVIQALGACVNQHMPINYNPRTDCLKKNHDVVNTIRKLTGI